MSEIRCGNAMVINNYVIKKNYTFTKSILSWILLKMYLEKYFVKV